MSYEPIPCPKCGADLRDHGEITTVDWVPARADYEGKNRVDLILNCEQCGTEFNAFVALDQFLEID